jgi:hypothetical protein
LNHNRRHPEYYAPSWSWASVTGPVTYPSGKSQLEILGVTEVSCKPSSSNPFGPASSGRLALTGIVAPVRIEQKVHRNSHTNQDQIRHFVVNDSHPVAKKLMGVIEPDVGPDGAELDGAIEESYLMLLAARTGSWPFGLLLRLSREDETADKRVGFLECARFMWSYWFEVVIEEA